MGIISNLFYFMSNGTFKKTLFHDVTLEEDILISSKWKEIKIQSLVKADKDRNFICILLEASLKNDPDEGGIRGSNGELFNPNIIVIDEDDNRYELAYSGGRGDSISNYEFDGKLPSNKSFKQVLLKSDFPFEAKKVLWSGYYSKDLK